MATAGFLAAAALLLASALGVAHRDQAGVGITIAALCSSAAALLEALRVLLPPTSGYLETAILLLLGGAGSGLFTTAVALSRRLHNVSPFAVGGAVLLAQALTLTDGGPAPLTGGDNGLAAQLNIALLVVLTLGWISVGIVLAIHACRELVRFIGSRVVRRALHATGLLLGTALTCAVILVTVAFTPAEVMSHRTVIGQTLTTTILVIATVLGLILTTTRLRTALRPQLATVRAALLFWRLAWLQRRLLAAAPHWAPPAGLRTPTPRNGALEALYARMVIIWDTTRALLSVTDTAVIDASLDFADRAEPGSGRGRRAAVAEAGWLHLALCDQAGHGPGEQFTVLSHDGVSLSTDLVGEAGFQLRVSRILRRENALLDRFREQYAAASTPDARQVDSNTDRARRAT